MCFVFFFLNSEGRQRTSVVSCNRMVPAGVSHVSAQRLLSNPVRVVLPQLSFRISQGIEESLTFNLLNSFQNTKISTFDFSKIKLCNNIMGWIPAF